MTEHLSTPVVPPGNLPDELWPDDLRRVGQTPVAWLWHGYLKPGNRGGRYLLPTTTLGQGTVLEPVYVLGQAQPIPIEAMKIIQTLHLTRESHFLFLCPAGPAVADIPLSGTARLRVCGASRLARTLPGQSFSVPVRAAAGARDWRDDASGSGGGA